MGNEAIKTKVCSHCRRELPLTAFPKNSHCRGGHSGVCRKCKTERARDYRRNLAEKARLYDERGGVSKATLPGSSCSNSSAGATRVLCISRSAKRLT